MVYTRDDASRDNVFVKMLSFLLFIALLFVLLYALYLLYLNIPGEPEALPVTVESPRYEEFTFSEVKQFYPNMKFNHNRISYAIESACDDDKKQRMRRAFNEIQESVSAITFFESQNFDDAEIQIICSEHSRDEIKEEYFVAGEGGAKEIVPTGRFNIVLNGVIYLYERKNFALKCDYPNIEVHELLHVLGFNHSESKKSIMYYLLESCDQVLDDSIITELRRLYALENLPDLYFENFTVIKKGRYLDFNVTVKNSGSVPVDGASFSIIEENEELETYPLERVTFGGGITIQTTNFRLSSRNPEHIQFVLDKENKIKEIDEKNNIALIKL
jgi:hypothetical protein